MKVSVITATYNSQANIINCIMSVNSQKYKNIQHVFVDGLSTDNTVDVIKQYSVRDAKLLSEKDAGIYDALNKGVKISDGDLIFFFILTTLYVMRQL